MNEKTIAKLEFDKVIRRLGDLCGSELGREVVRGTVIFDNHLEISDALAATREAKRFLDIFGSVWDFGALPDLSGGLLSLEGGQVLDGMELRGFMEALELSGKIKGRKLPEGEFDHIEGERQFLFAGTAIVRRIEASIDEQGEVKDNATPALARARKAVRELENGIPEKLRRMFALPGVSDVLQDRVVTMRNGRFVIPVKSDVMGRGTWVLQDRSASGATSFVEPIGMVEDNNRLVTERLMERAETARVLREISGELATHYTEIRDSLKALGRLDALLARGKYANELYAVEPKISDDGKIDIRRGRHPLLKGKVVPVDVEIGGDVKALVLTGPNAGGKTVSLKMAGLFQMMMQAGLHVPGEEGTRMPVFHDVFAVIGDEQSIENNLSTFSSHLSDMKWILDRVGRDCLVLIDEICSGTDPEEGTALACGMLRKIIDSGAICLATSHHGGLKTFASVTPGVKNARMAFDEDARRPSYRIEVGIPGKSYAIEAAEAVGISADVTASAREYLSAQTRMAEKLIAELDEMKNFLAIEKKHLDGERDKIRREAEQQHRVLTAAEREKDRMLGEAYSHAEKIVADTRSRCLAILAEAGNASKSLPAVARLKGIINKEEVNVERARREVTRKKGRVAAEDLVCGKRFQLRDTGELVVYESGPDARGKVKIMLGEFPATVLLEDITYPDPAKMMRPEKPKARDYTKFLHDAKDRAKREIDLRGMRAVEAIEKLDSDLETLMLAGEKEARVIHGIGTGALMKAVHEFLPSCRMVKRFEICPLSEGGSGATKVFFE